MRILRSILLVVVIIFVLTGLAYAELPDLPKQELGVKIVSLLVGLGIIITLSVFGLNAVIYKIMNQQGDLASKISVVLAALLSYLWFLYLFGQIFNTMISIAFGVLIVVLGLVYFFQSSGRETDNDDDDEENTGFSY